MKSKNLKQQLGLQGLYNGHLKILKSKEGERGTLLILEDDVFITKAALKKVNKIVEHTFHDRDWDIIRPVPDGTHPTSPYFLEIWEDIKERANNSQPSALEKINNSTYKFKYSTPHSKKHKKGDPPVFAGGTHFVLVNKKNITKILNYLQQEQFGPIDSMYSTNQINSYVIKIPSKEIKPIYAKFGTDIGENKFGHYNENRAKKINIEYE